MGGVSGVRRWTGDKMKPPVLGRDRRPLGKGGKVGAKIGRGSDQFAELALQFRDGQGGEGGEGRECGGGQRDGGGRAAGGAAGVVVVAVATSVYGRDDRGEDDVGD